jgi:hypothetical protein
LVSIVVLTAFVLGISLLVKTIATTDPAKALAVAAPILARLHIDSQKVGSVAGKFVERLNNTGLSDSKNDGTSQSSVAASSTAVNSKADEPGKEILMKVAILADVHEFNGNLVKALQLAKQAQVANVFFLGDYTDFGDVPKLTEAKKVMDAGGLSYYSLPGDHDLAQSSGPSNYIQVFGNDYFVVTLAGIKFVGLDNSANYTPISQDRLTWFNNQIEGANFILLAQPVYHSSSLSMMGIVNGDVTPNVRAQAVEILKITEESGAKAVISADLHQSSISVDPVRSDLKHVVIGSLADERNLQTPRFTILTVFKDGSFDVKDVLIQ